LSYVLAEFQYWNPALLKSEFSRKLKHRYVAFDVDLGGLNNVRLVLEYVAVIAAITGRTLVLPPPQGWYLLDYGPKHRPGESGRTSFSDLFDIPALREVVPVITTAEFVTEAGRHLGIPDEFRPPDVFSESVPAGDGHRRWKRWLLDNAEAMKGWNPHDTLICMPDIDQVRSECDLPEHYVDRRRMIEFTPWTRAAPLLHFPCDEAHRSLGPVATMLAATDRRLAPLTRRLIKHHIRWHPRIFELASRYVEYLKLYRYDAVHIRRNDFQYKQTRTAAEDTWRNVSGLLDNDLPLYVATDEPDGEFLDCFRSRKRVLTWDDITRAVGGCLPPEKYAGPIEQLICAGARRFIGTDLSTFSSYIVRLRGYIRAPDMASYFHNRACSPTGPEPDDALVPGRTYLTENPLYWLNC
jgi:hypothetical protein